MKENNLQKKPRSAEEYANLFLLDENGEKRDFSKTNSVCFITIGYAETLWILLQEFAGKDITIIDRKSEIDFIEALIKIHNRDDIKIVRKIEVETEEVVLNTILDLNMSFDLIIANPPYSNSFYKQIINRMVPFCSQLSILAPWDLVTAANKGKTTRDMLNNHVIDYTQMSAEIFGSPLQLICGSFDFTKETGKYLEPFNPHSIDAVIFKKFAECKDQMKDHVYWSKGITGNNNDPVKCEKFIKGSYNHQVFRSISALRYPKRLLTEPDELLGVSMWGIPDETSYNLIKKAVVSEDFQQVVKYVTKLIGDARNVCQKEVSHIPLFTKFEELNLTNGEIERIKNM